MICKVISITALLFLLFQSIAYSEEQGYLHLDTEYMMINFGHSYYKRTLNKHSRDEHNISVSDYVIGTDLLTSLRYSKQEPKDYYYWGPWIGGDIGLLDISHQASYLFGVLSVGWVIGFNIENMFEYYLGVGMGISYAYLDNDRYQLAQNTSTGAVCITGIGFWPFVKSSNFLKSLGFSFRYKFLPFLPEVREVAGGDSFSPDVDIFLGIAYRF